MTTIDYSAAQRVVLQTMSRKGLEPIPLKSRQQSSANFSREVRNVFDKYASALKIADISSRKNSRILLGDNGYNEYSLYFSNLNPPHFDFSLLGGYVGDIPTALRYKKNATVGTLFGLLNDDLRVPYTFNKSGEFEHVPAYFDLLNLSSSEREEVLAEKGVSQSELVKQIVNYFNGSQKNAYVYFTDKFFATHFKALAKKLDSSTCLTHEAAHYGHPFKGRYKHPLKTLEKSPNVLLALVSDKHHSEWVEDEYPFVARAFVLKHMKRNEFLGVSRVYGQEAYTRDLLCRTLGTDYGMKGALLKPMLDDNDELMIPHVDQLTQDSEDRNAMCWLEDAPIQETYFLGMTDEHYETLSKERWAIAGCWGYASPFSVTPSYDGFKVSSPSTDNYIRSWLPTPERFETESEEY